MSIQQYKSSLTSSFKFFANNRPKINKLALNSDWQSRFDGVLVFGGAMHTRVHLEHEPLAYKRERSRWNKEAIAFARRSI